MLLGAYSTEMHTYSYVFHKDMYYNFIVVLFIIYPN